MGRQAQVGQNAVKCENHHIEISAVKFKTNNPQAIKH